MAIWEATSSKILFCLILQLWKNFRTAWGCSHYYLLEALIHEDKKCSGGLHVYILHMHYQKKLEVKTIVVSCQKVTTNQISCL